MTDDIPWPPDTGWGIEARQLRDQGYGPNQAVDRVVLKYLGLGDPRPLLDLLRRGKTPGSDVLRYLAAMIDPEYRTRFPNEPPQYEIRFRPVGRKPERPKRSESVGASDFHEFFKAYTTAMAEGRQPDSSFWKYLYSCLCYPLDPTQFQEVYKTDVRLTAKLVRIDGRKGGKRDPELETRDNMVAELVQERIDEFGPGNYDSAIKTVRNVMEDHVKKDLEQATARGEEARVRYLYELQKTKWEKTIKDAYDRRIKGKRLR